MKYKFWGVRGSIPTPGPETVGYGGNTSCGELTLDDGSMIIFDMGSGIRVLGNDLMKRGKKPVEAIILLSHTHWDHIQGFPFFVPAFIPGNKILICGCEEADIKLETIIKDQMKSAYFPVELSDMPAAIGFKRLYEGRFKISGARVDTMYLNHPGFTLAYRVEYNGKSVVYASDNEPYPIQPNDSPEMAGMKYQGKDNHRIIEFSKNCDLLIHDCQYTPEQYKTKVGWGHSPYDYVAEIAWKANVKRLAVHHHDPSHDDAFVDGIVNNVKNLLREKGARAEAFGAREGLEIEL
ncbi:MAG TPA: MBL fold metallo-hydrolase [bacterium]|nr:MBL fold metallo-hydrolase [bacterium]HMZ03555.1 MBL fold metallo-hydrolase [bacterium]HNB56674.1 MBL fold metallo-hydrolase [bacterium]HND76120.1 MBL fold metallo-hydrolase [bacterium]HNE83481.1 MBL fold metallo-hydrolase [bacterium]